MRRPAIKILVLVGSVAAWLAMTEFVGPKLVRDGFASQSFGPINDFFSQRRSNPPEFYLDKLRVLSSWGAAFVGLVGACFLFVAREARQDYSWSRRVIGVATPESLGMIRLIVCSILAACTFHDGLPSVALLPRDLIGEQGFGVISLARIVPGFRAMEASWPALQALQAITIGALVLGAVGLMTRWVLPVALVGYLLSAGLVRTPIYISHGGLASMYVLAVLSFTPCGDGFSVDRRLANRRPGASPWSGPSLAYGWARFGCWMTIAIVYFSAGLSKLVNGGIYWWEPRTMRSRILACALDTMPLNFDLALQLKDTPDVVLAALGIATLIIELGMIFTPFSRIARWTLPISCVFMHLGIVFLQNIHFYDLMAIQAIFMVPDRFRGFFKHGSLPPDESRPSRPVSPVMVAGVLALLVGMGLGSLSRVEYYPITAWGMFSDPPSPEKTTIEYHKLLAHYDNGTTTRAYPEREIAALTDTRYRYYFWSTWFADSGGAKLDKFLRCSGSIHNASPSSGPKIAEYELQQWQWDWEKEPDDPGHGRMIKSHRVPITP